ncbi:undecaprenyl-phosphate glucose phosphotransferase [Vibrio ulleungensis]|uniref:Undecaprenyl-phosphate glucose phosphotransferase n=1 Tax=Vibrio ulleungensis TaxID=2807619 RepID=A0ABS2HFF3_9VIBR|nr:undecaprenyl-phosphate glucose phosphotransferase [Vibrio ulleungensis]MBM7036295.1 undecaprenyl-phosphate glucose phosphotransferase [Vibrio ulleungensis]
MEIKTNSTEFSFLYRAADCVIILLSLYICAKAQYVELTNAYIVIATYSVVLFLLTSESVGLYRSWRTSKMSEQIMTLLCSWVMMFAAILLVNYAISFDLTYSNALLKVWFIFTPICLVFWRLIIMLAKEKARDMGYNRRTAVIIGVTENGLQLAQELRDNHQLGIDLVGFYDDRQPDRLDQQQMNATLEGNADEALEYVRGNHVDHVYIAMPMSAQSRIAHYLKEFSDTTANTYVVPDFFVFNLIQSRINVIGNVPTLSVHDTPFYGGTVWLKRLQDIILSSLILVLISPVLVAVALGVKLTSAGPVIFKQKRYGLDGRQISVWKFRSMTTMENGNEVKQATKNDARVTPFGAFIRRTSLDELPQFINVLQGRMSIVGPRPHAVVHNEQYRVIVDRYMLRHKVKPGITGLAQVSGYRGETDTLEKMEKRVEYDLRYIDSWSTWLDLKIIFMTVFKGFVGKTAY